MTGLPLDRRPQHRRRRRQHRLGRRGRPAPRRPAERGRRARARLLRPRRHAADRDRRLRGARLPRSATTSSAARCRSTSPQRRARSSATSARRSACPVDEAAAAVMRVVTENMVQLIEELSLNQGVDPRSAVLIGGGGAAGLNAVAIARRLNMPQVVIPETGATLSAVGGLLSDLSAEFATTFVTTSQRFDYDAANQVLAASSRSARRSPRARATIGARSREPATLRRDALPVGGLGARGAAARRSASGPGRRRGDAPGPARGAQRRVRHPRPERAGPHRRLARARELPRCGPASSAARCGRAARTARPSATRTSKASAGRRSRCATSSRCPAARQVPGPCSSSRRSRPSSSIRARASERTERGSLLITPWRHDEETA